MEILAAFGLICLIPLLVVGGTIWCGYVGSKLWIWFVVPQFGLAPLSINTAIGLSVLIGLYSSQRAEPKDKERTGYAALGYCVARIALIPALALLMGWIALKFRG